MPHPFLYKTGLYILIISLLLLIIDRTTELVSTFIGRQICGDQYLCPVDGVVCDRSCGFNTDMHLTFFLVITMILGMLLIKVSRKNI